MISELAILEMFKLLFIWGLLFITGIYYLAEDDSLTFSWFNFTRRKRKKHQPDDSQPLSENYVSIFERESLPAGEKKPKPKNILESIISGIKIALMICGTLILMGIALIIVPFFGIFYLLKCCLAIIVLLCLTILEIILETLRAHGLAGQRVNEILLTLREF